MHKEQWQRGHWIRLNQQSCPLKEKRFGDWGVRIVAHKWSLLVYSTCIKCSSNRPVRCLLLLLLRAGELTCNVRFDEENTDDRGEEFRSGRCQCHESRSGHILAAWWTRDDPIDRLAMLTGVSWDYSWFSPMPRQNNHRTRFQWQQMNRESEQCAVKHRHDVVAHCWRQRWEFIDRWNFTFTPIRVSRRGGFGVVGRESIARWKEDLKNEREKHS